MQCFYWIDGGIYTACLACRSVYCDSFIFSPQYLPDVSGVGTLVASTGIMLFTISKPSMSYWDLEFPAVCLSVLGVDFVFPSGSLFIAKLALPYEQSMVGALFSVMAQVCFMLFLDVNDRLIELSFGSLPLHLG